MVNGKSKNSKPPQRRVTKRANTEAVDNDDRQESVAKRKFNFQKIAEGGNATSESTPKKEADGNRRFNFQKAEPESTSSSRGRGRPKQIEPSTGVLKNFASRKEMFSRLSEVVKEDLERVTRAVLAHIQGDVIRREELNWEEHQARQMCRLKYHLYNSTEKGPWEPISRAYHRFWKRFVIGADDVDELSEKRGADADLACHVKRQMEEEEEEVTDYDVEHKLSVTFCRECDAECAVVDTTEASNIRATLLDILLRKECVPSVVTEFLNKHARCYQGLRTLQSRLKQYQSLREAKNVIDSMVLKCNVMEIVGNLPLSFATKSRLWAILDVRRNDSYHEEHIASEMYGTHKAAFESTVYNRRDMFCDVCNLMTDYQNARKHVKKESIALAMMDCKKCDRAFDCTECVRDHILCHVCARHLPKHVPPLASINGLTIDGVPRCINELNTVERMIIQKARVLQKVVCLRDIVNRPTGMKASAGAMVVVPTHVQATIDEVLHRLPSSSNMKIVVETSWDKKYVVSMRRVINALKWLIENNPEYADIIINREFNFTIGKDVVFEDPEATQHDANNLIRRDDRDEIENVVEEFKLLQPIHQPNSDQLTAVERFKLQQLPYCPLQGKDPKAELWAFFDSFPYGRNAMYQMSNIKPSAYLRAMLLNKNRRLATNMLWVAYCYARKIQNGLSERCGTMARTVKGAQEEIVDLDGPYIANRLSSLYSKLPGFHQYWLAVRNRLEFMVAVFGPPTFFLTLNPNEREWTDLHDQYANVVGHHVDKDNIRAEIEKDPSIFSRYWNKRVRYFVDKVLLKPDGPLGVIIHFYWRVEYQHRGTQHLHCLLWARDRPSEEASQEDQRLFVDRHITARMPTPEEPELERLVRKHQLHNEKCNPTCRKRKSVRGRVFTICRFNFPRPLRQCTVVRNSDTGFKASKRCYDLARYPGEEYVNDYNAAILLAWKGNVDLQYVGNNKSVLSYITSYTSKGEVAKKLEEGSKNPVSQTQSKVLYAAGIDELNSREVGALEMMDALLGHENFAFDMADVWIPTDPLTTRTRMLKRKGSGELVDNLVDTYYPNRSTKLQEFSLFNVATNFKWSAVRPVDTAVELADQREETSNETTSCIDSIRDLDGYHVNDPTSPFYRHPAESTGFEVMGSTVKFIRVKQRLGRFHLPQFDEEAANGLEEFYRRLCLLFIPWRSEQHFLDEQDASTYTEAFMNFLDRLESRSSAGYSDVVRIVASFRDLVKDRKDRRERIAMAATSTINEVEYEELQIEPRIVDEEEHESRVKALNAEQRELYDKVMFGVEECTNGGRPMLMYVSGVAGVGKTFVIECVADSLQLKYGEEGGEYTRPTCLLCAPTGLAAIAIRGQTLHTMFGIEVQTGNDASFKPLSDEQRDLRRTLFQNVKLIIVDEISMVSSTMLMKIRNRLREIKGTSDEFGGVSIVVFGDLLQLPPVRAPWIFNPMPNYIARRVFGGNGNQINIWRLFNFFELSINMRQQNDLEYAELLGRLRVGALTQNDVTLLEQRVLPRTSEDEHQSAAQHYVAIVQQHPSVMTLYPHYDDVRRFNSMVIGLVAEETVTIPCTESSSRKRKEEVARPWQLKEFSLVKQEPIELRVPKHEKMAGGLVESLVVAKGARVMLKRTIDRTKGHVNGLVGSVVDVETVGEEVARIGVRFDRFPDEVSWIRRVSAIYDFSHTERRTRTQFPLDLAFAATIHKSQGMTLDAAIVSVKNCFANAQTYVALSRVKCLSGLHLLDFDVTKVKVDNAALEEYSVLRCVDSEARTPFQTPPPLALLPASSCDKMTTGGLLLRNPFQTPPPLSRLPASSCEEMRTGGLLLRNRLDDCFVNTAVNMLYAVSMSSQWFNGDVVDDHPIVQELVKLFTKSSSSAAILRDNFEDDELKTGQRDVLDAFSELMAVVPFQIHEAVTVEQQKVWRCDECGDSRTRTTYLCTIVKAVYERSTWNELMSEANEDRLRTCTRCHMGQEVPTTTHTVMPATTQLVVQIGSADRFDYVEGIPLESTMFGARWELQAATEYIPRPDLPFRQGGHYVTWWKDDDHWTRISDDICDKQPFNADFRLISVLVYKRLL